jgi:hypothetical protein
MTKSETILLTLGLGKSLNYDVEENKAQIHPSSSENHEYVFSDMLTYYISGEAERQHIQICPCGTSLPTAV